jgi:hypothetical protein
MRPWARRDELSLNCWVPGIYGGSKNNLVELYEKQATSLPDKASNTYQRRTIETGDMNLNLRIPSINLPLGKPEQLNN